MTSVHWNQVLRRTEGPAGVRPPVIGKERSNGNDESILTSGTMLNPDVKKTPPPLPPKPKGLTGSSPQPLNSDEPPEVHCDPGKSSTSLQLSDKPVPAKMDSSPPTAGSETSRSYHPEGSVDLSPSCSESLPTTPSYLKWAESMNYLLDDGDGCGLFKDYLDQQRLGHLLEFVLAVKGFRIQMLEQKPDADLQLRLIKTINKRYVNSLGKNMSSRCECLSPVQRKSLEDLIVSKSGLDISVFDSAYQTVVDHLESKCYPNFLTSEIYIEHVRSYQQNESEIASSRYSANQSSTASSVSGHPGSQPLRIGTNADDSGISGITNVHSSDRVRSEASEGTATISSSTSLPSMMSPTQPQVPAEGATSFMTSTSCSVSQLLPTVREDTELSLASPVKAIVQSSAPVISNPFLAASGARPKRYLSASVSSLPVTEQHPTVTSASYPYHANSSTWNPVSRQDSEIQSQSSGAAVGGDTTDDNYSTLRDNRSSRSERRPHSKPITHADFRNKDAGSTQFIPRPKIPLEPTNLAHNPNKFAQTLISKLSKLEADQAKDSKLRGALDRASAGVSGYDQNDDQDLESDQSILDDHVDRVFNEEKAHNVSSAQFNSSRLMSSSFHAGYRTIDSKHRATSGSQFGSGVGPQPYRVVSNATVAGDLAYYPATNKGSMASNRSGVLKSFSDTDFGITHPQARMPHHAAQYAAHYHPSAHGSSDRVSDWLKNTMSTSAVDPSTFKTSPRNSGRHQKRARSQDRYGMHNMSAGHFGMSHTGPYPGIYVDQAGASMVVREASQRLARSTHATSVGQPSGDYTTARYTFPQSKDTTPFLVRIPKPAPVTLGDVKRHLPKKSAFRFYFKTEMDGEEVVFQEETNDASFVPMWKGSVVVQCNAE